MFLAYSFSEAKDKNIKPKYKLTGFLALILVDDRFSEINVWLENFSFFPKRTTFCLNIDIFFHFK